MEESKSLETMYGMIWIDSDHSLHPNQSLMKCDVWQPCSDQRWLASIFNLKIFWANAFTNNHLLCYWPTIYNLISKICPKFQSLSSHFFKVDELLHKHWAKIVQSENVQVSTPIYIECNKMYWPNVCIQGFWYIFCLAFKLILNLGNPRTAILHAKKLFSVSRLLLLSCRDTTIHIPFFHEPMAQWLLWVAVSQTSVLGSISSVCWNSLPVHN